MIPKSVKDISGISVVVLLCFNIILGGPFIVYPLGLLLLMGLLAIPSQ